jgi:16S rRNA (uracil1498-N3)-methyltransferase
MESSPQSPDSNGADPAALSLRSTSAHLLLEPERFDRLELDDATEHHLRRVLRLRDGERVSLTDGLGRWCLGTVAVSGSSITVGADSDVISEPQRTDRFTLAVAMPKGDRLDWLVQKVTELGVDRLVLLHAQRSVVRWTSEKTPAQLARLQRISDEACRQSRRVWRVDIDAPVTAMAVLPSYVVAEPGGRAVTPEDRAVAVGPEGGWSPDELDAASGTVGLGANILRTETAALAITALCVAYER